MDLLIKKAVIIDKDKSLNGETKDILISKGRIQKIAKNISSPNAKKIESPNLHCSIGWCDIGTHLGEPGYEQRETTDSICEAASAGGYTTLIPFPVTEPIIQSASDLKYLKSVFSNKIQDVYPIAALSKNTTGTELTEMRDLEAHGAVAFGDGLHSVNSAGLMMKALQYASASKCPIIDFPPRSVTVQ